MGCWCCGGGCAPGGACTEPTGGCMSVKFGLEFDTGPVGPIGGGGTGDTRVVVVCEITTGFWVGFIYGPLITWGCCVGGGCRSCGAGGGAGPGAAGAGAGAAMVGGFVVGVEATGLGGRFATGIFCGGNC